MRPFADLSRRSQIGRLRVLARRALDAWGLADAELRLVNHGYNATYGVRTPEGRWALRLNVNAHKEREHLHAELAWLAALSRDTDLAVPVPRATRTGEPYTVVDSPEHGRALPAVLFGWLPGRTPGKELTRDQSRALGRAAASLHAHAEGWRLPPGASLPSMQPLHMNIPERLSGGHRLLPAGGQEVVAEATHLVQGYLDALFARAPALPIHGDLHGGNLRWQRGRLGVLDFDDAGVGLPAQDLAIAAYYLRGETPREQTFLDAYAAVRPLPDVTEAEFEAMLLGRTLLLANDIAESANAEFQSFAAAFVHNAVLRARHWLDTGRFARLPDELSLE